MKGYIGKTEMISGLMTAVDIQVVMVDSGKLGLFTIAGFSIVLCQVLSLFWITSWSKDLGIGGLMLFSYLFSLL